MQGRILSQSCRERHCRPLLWRVPFVLSCLPRGQAAQSVVAGCSVFASGGSFSSGAAITVASQAMHVALLIPPCRDGVGPGPPNRASAGKLGASEGVPRETWSSLRRGLRPCDDGKGPQNILCWSGLLAMNAR